MKFLSLLGAEIEQNIYFASAILKIQNGGHADISANVINNFRIPHGLTFPKMYRFANLPKFGTKIHNEPDYCSAICGCYNAICVNSVVVCA